MRMVIAGAMACATAIGGAVGATVVRWSGGIATQGDVDKAIATRASMEDLAAVRAAIGHLRNGADPPTIYERLAALEADTRIGLVERISIETRARVGFQIQLRIGLDPRRKEAAERAAANARARFDEYVLQGMSPAEAAAKVIDTSTR